MGIFSAIVGDELRFQGVPKNAIHRAGSTRPIRLGKDVKLIDISPPRVETMAVVYEPYEGAQGGEAYAFSVSPVTHHIGEDGDRYKDYVLVQAAYSFCLETESFRRSIAKDILTEIMSNSKLERHLAFAIHFPASSLIPFHTNTAFRSLSLESIDTPCCVTSEAPRRISHYELPGSRFLRDALLDKIRKAGAMSLVEYNEAAFDDDDVEEDADNE